MNQNLIRNSKEFVKIKIPTSQYFIFESFHNKPEKIGETWKNIWHLSETDKEFNNKRSYKLEFEQYKSNGEINIYIGKNLMDQKYRKITFKSQDKIFITADFYEVKNSKNLILCCHRSHCNRAEYREICPKLNLLKYSCLAIDQRSGMNVFGEINETKQRAKEKNLPTSYLDAKKDIDASIDYAFNLNQQKPIILWGSSYSGSLALLSSVNNNKIKSTIVFSPGNYLKNINIAEELESLKLPIFATSTKDEISQVENVFTHVDKNCVFQFKPTFAGFHGSKALWESTKNHEYYWDNLILFLKKLK